MGRDAFFSTGLERRFAFAVQSSYDMQLFGGRDVTTEASMARGNFEHVWHAEKDMPYIHKKLADYLDETDISLPDFASYEKSLKGTQKLRYDLYKQVRELHEWIGSDCNTYELGCLIYHQLMYDPKLSVHYEP